MKKWLTVVGLIALAGAAVNFLLAEPPKKPRRCSATTKKGKRSSADTAKGSEYCPQHRKLLHLRDKNEE